LLQPRRRSRKRLKGKETNSTDVFGLNVFFTAIQSLLTTRAGFMGED
jgi:hypothetical protein